MHILFTPTRGYMQNSKHWKYWYKSAPIVFPTLGYTRNNKDLKYSCIKVPILSTPTREYMRNSEYLKAIFCRSHPTYDSRVIRICSYFNQLKMKVILEYCRNFSSIMRSVKFLLGSRDNSGFTRNEISLHKLYFESSFSILELIFRVQVTSTWTR